MNTPGGRLRAIREQNGYATAKDAAVAMGVPIATYTQHEKAKRFLPSRRAAEYAQFFGTTPEYILYARDDAVRDRVPIIDRFGNETSQTAMFPASPTELTVAQQGCPDDGIAHFGFVALYEVPQSRNVASALDGKLCVVSVVGDAELRLIRVLKQGSSPEKFHLLSAAGGLPMVDQSLKWAAPVIALVPAHV